MIQLEQIRKYFPVSFQRSSIYDKHMLKEYLQLLILDYLSSTKYIHKLIFIGGTNLRLVKGIDRFSEDLDFDCPDLSKEEFLEMTDSVFVFLKKNGYRVEAKDRESDKLKAFRRSIYFPELLFELGLTGYREERFLIKIESQDQHINYPIKVVNVKGCGFFFPLPMPSDEVLCSMKISAMLSRNKGRDFYDVMFLLSLTQPDYTYLSQKCNISNLSELKKAVSEMLTKVDLKLKMKDFEHLIFNKDRSSKILKFGEFINELVE